MKILFKYATRSRPELFKRGVDSIVNNALGEYSILVSADADDLSMNNDEMIRWCNAHPRILLVFGKSKNKVDAINRDMNTVGFRNHEIICNMSDDMVFTKKGFDDIIRNEFVSGYEDHVTSYKFTYNLDRCIHLPDGNRSDLITMAIMGRDYYNRFGYIYHPDYKSLYCDNEMTDVAKQLKCYKYVDKQIFEHRHPAYGKAVFDAQYQHTESFNQEDRDTYLKRRALNFGL